METEKDLEKGKAPIVSIDGAKAKRIREGKKLTQLYVASVVGVTTDTISRWENNRYPSIRRDNAEKFAAALEVDLAEILKQEAPEEQPLAPKRSRNTYIIGIILVILLVAVAYLAISWFAGTPPSAKRLLPRHAPPGATIPVQIDISRNDAEGKGIIVKEKLPHNWRLIKAIPAPAAGQAGGEEIKWLLPAGTGPAVISFTVRVPAEAPLGEKGRFIGVIAGETGAAQATGGEGLLTVSPYHWADANADGAIDDGEIMPTYYLTEEMKGMGLDWNEIESIWSGKGYRWEKGKFVVLP